jgi:hypothetical protein
LGKPTTGLADGTPREILNGQRLTIVMTQDSFDDSAFAIAPLLASAFDTFVRKSKAFFRRPPLGSDLDEFLVDPGWFFPKNECPLGSDHAEEDCPLGAVGTWAGLAVLDARLTRLGRSVHLQKKTGPGPGRGRPPSRPSSQMPSQSLLGMRTLTPGLRSTRASTLNAAFCTASSSSFATCGESFAPETSTMNLSGIMMTLNV